MHHKLVTNIFSDTERNEEWRWNCMSYPIHKDRQSYRMLPLYSWAESLLGRSRSRLSSSGFSCASGLVRNRKGKHLWACEKIFTSSGNIFCWNVPLGWINRIFPSMSWNNWYSTPLTKSGLSSNKNPSYLFLIYSSGTRSRVTIGAPTKWRKTFLDGRQGSWWKRCPHLDRYNVF